MNNTKDTIIKISVLVFLIICFVAVYIFLNKKKNTEIKTFGVNSPIIHTVTTKANSEKASIHNYDDKLGVPTEIKQYELDEYGVGTQSNEIFYFDINKDGYKDKITKTRESNGNAHSYYEYKIELNLHNKYYDITPANFRNIESADCALQQLQFIYEPEFTVIKIARKWEKTWDTPTTAKKTIYKLIDNKLVPTESIYLKKVCDVSELFD